MVLINTQTVYSTLSFKYFMEIPRCDCVFGSAREENGKTHLFLVFNERGRIYKRKGLTGTWAKITSPAEYSQIRCLVNHFRRGLVAGDESDHLRGEDFQHQDQRSQGNHD